MSATKRVPKEEYAQQKREEQRTLLAEAVERMCSSEGWMNYLDACRKHTARSFRNKILIALQDPESSVVEGAKTWPKKWDRSMLPEGYDNPILILAPIMKPMEDANGNPILGADGKPRQKVVFYKTVKVYDQRYTEGKEIASIPLEPITGASHEEYLYRAEQYIVSLGVQVEYGTEPFYWRDSPLVAQIDARKAVNSQVRELIRACAEISGVDMFAGMDNEPSDEEKRVTIESAAYLACQAVGLDTSGMTVPYIASWGQGEDAKAALKTLSEFASTIDALAATVTEAIS